MRRAVIGVVLAILVCAAAVAGAMDAVEWYQKGADAYDAGNFEEAIEYFSNTINKGDYSKFGQKSVRYLTMIGKISSLLWLYLNSISLR